MHVSKSALIYRNGGKSGKQFLEMVSVSVCRICLENLSRKYGTCVATVPLFLETCNKEFSNVLSGKSIILAQLLLDLKIIASHDGSSSVCKKCARKIVNCYKLFVELQKAFAVGSGVSRKPQTPDPKNSDPRVSRKLRPKKLRPSGVSKTQTRKTQTLWVSRKLRPEKIRPSGCLENSDPKNITNLHRVKVASRLVYCSSIQWHYQNLPRKERQLIVLGTCNVHENYPPRKEKTACSVRYVQRS